MKREKSQLKNFIIGLALTVALAMPAVSRAANVVMTANDANGATTSFNGDVGHWSPAGVPSAGNTYSTVGYLLRGPNVAGSYTFGGDSLTVGGGGGGGAFSPVTPNNNSLIFKADGETLTVNNLILDGSQIRDGNGSGNNAHLTGNITVTANGGAFMAQDTNWIDSAISGSSIIYIGDNGSGEDRRVIIFTSGYSTFSGNIMLTNTHSSVNYSRLTLAPGSIMNFTIGANGVNNHIFGQGTLQLNGNFAFDLSGADNTIGDSWSIVDQVNSSVTYGSTFAINGFTQNGTLWDEIAKGVDYDYNTLTGVLTVENVPEPGVCGMMLLGGGMLLGLRRFRRA